MPDPRVIPRQFTVFVERRLYGRSVDVHITERSADDTFITVARPVVFERLEAAALEVIPPALSLRPELAQQLVDELWTAGFRPTQGRQSEGQFGAMNAHLQDLRALVAATMKVELPGAKP